VEREGQLACGVGICICHDNSWRLGLNI
jgi:hypothetical protein